jgi:hypothetical protein
VFLEGLSQKVSLSKDLKEKREEANHSVFGENVQAEKTLGRRGPG